MLRPASQFNAATKSPDKFRAQANSKSRTRRASRANSYTLTSPERFCAQYHDYTGLQVVHPHAAGIDIGGSLSHFVAVEVTPNVLEVREFGCDTVDLYALRKFSTPASAT